MSAFLADTLATGTPPRRAFFEAVPVIDLSALGADEAANRIGSACTEPGFFYLDGHGVPAAHIEAVFATMEAFFALPHDEKMTVAMKHQSNRRGFSPVGERATDSAAGADQKESLDFGAEGIDFALGGGNPWPLDPPALRRTVETLQADLVALSLRLLERFAEALGIAPDHFSSRSQQSIARMKLLHYPPTAPGSSAPGVGAHTDYGVLTLLIQRGVPGLQLKNADGSWLDVEPREQAILVNLGDQMAKWTNDIFQATPHRVYNRSGRERYTIAFFFHPDHDAVIEPLPVCISPAYPPRYATTTAGDDLVAAYASPDSAYNYERHTGSTS